MNSPNMHRIRIQLRVSRSSALLKCVVALAAGLATTRAAEPPPGMVRIPAGIYRPLFNADTNRRAVLVRAFYLDVLPVSRDDFLEFVRANPRWRRSQVNRLFADESYLADLDPGTNAPAKAPVTSVSWFAVKAYAQWKGKRLPTIAEWEYAAAAGSNRADGENDPEFKNEILRWYTTPSAATLAPVGASRANFWGIHDLHGLVWEWVSDFNLAVVAGDPRSGAGPEREPFCGGGSQGATDVDNYPAFMRDAFRTSLKANYCLKNLGFRCARDL